MDSLRLALVFLLVSLCASSTVYGKGKKPVILDLGRIQIEGEVRRPFIKVLDTSESIKKVVNNMKINELSRFESQMLAPLPLPSKKGK